MGGTVSRGIDNQSLIDELISSGTTLTPELERAMRLVDRGDYAQERNQRVYMDLAWRSKTLHLSAPSIYAVALQNLDIEPGLHFLNIGSGTGYLSTIVGLILGENGVNHGLEVEKLNVAYARERLAAFIRECDAPFERSFCTPYFMQGNILDLVAPPVTSGNTPGFGSNTARGARSQQDDTSVGIYITLINPSISPSRGSTLGAFFPPTLQSTRSGNSPIAEDADETLENDAMDEEPESTTMDGNQNIEMSEESAASGLDENEDDDDDEEEEEGFEGGARTYHSIMRDGHCSIAPPPVLSNNPELLHNDTDDSLSRWPLYDRIYVGAAIVDRSHLEAILRLLKVGGIMVAPVRDKFLKIKRTSENSISITELMSVSFATLVVPPSESSHLVEIPPPREVASLEQTCARLIRARLKKVIEFRHNGLPVLGRLQEIKTNIAQQAVIDLDKKTSHNGISTKSADDGEKNNGNTKLPDNDLSKPLNNSTSNCVDSSSSLLNSTALFVSTADERATTTTTSSNSSSSRTAALDSSHPIRQIRSLFGGFITHSTGDKDQNHDTGCTNDDDNGDNEVTNSDMNRDSNDDPESRGSSPKRQKSQYHWVDQNYTYKEEMKKILLEELHFTAFLARSVISL